MLSPPSATTPHSLSCLPESAHRFRRTEATIDRAGASRRKNCDAPNGVDTDQFAPIDRTTARQQTNLGLTAGDLVIGIVGRFGPFKRHTALIDAFSQVASEFPNLRLLIVGGGGPEEERVRSHAAQSPAAPRIHFTGFQQDPRLYYQSLDLLVVPSINEGLSNAILEAMSCAIPALANNTCGNGEIITSGRDGLIADLSQPALIASAIETLLDSGNLGKMGQNARQTMIKSFSINRMVYNYVSLYREVSGREHKQT
jgi:glycosyltransferase involved in cell wall biosynthesis